jgi:hypothetical protein
VEEKQVKTMHCFRQSYFGDRGQYYGRGIHLRLHWQKELRRDRMTGGTGEDGNVVYQDKKYSCKYIPRELHNSKQYMVSSDEANMQLQN